MSIDRPTLSSERLERAVVAGFGGFVALVLVYLIGYAVANLLTLVAPVTSLSHRLLADWLQALVHNRLVDPSQPTLYIALGLQAALAIAGAVVYAAWVEPRFERAGWVGGFIVACILWALAGLVVLPLIGAGIFGAALGAGPLPAYTSLLAYLAYGVVLSLAYAPGESAIWWSDAAAATPPRMTGWDTTALGMASGALAGAVLGLFLGALVPWQGGAVPGGLAPVALMVALGLAGAALGEFIGSLSGLPTAPGIPAAAAAGVAPRPFVPAMPTAVPVFRWRELRVVAAHGTCQRGFGVGQTFRCDALGQIEPHLCPAAQQALQPLARAMVEGRPDAPRQLICPIYDHALVFELASAG